MPAHVGQLRNRLAFEKRPSLATGSPQGDGYGNARAVPWEEQFELWARVEPKFGSEAVTAARLTGRQPVTIVVRNSANAALIEASWRATDTKTGEVYALTSPAANLDEKGAYLEFLATTGVAA